MKCVTCNNLFKGKGHQIYCSDKCNDKAYYLRNKEKIKKRVKKYQDSHFERNREKNNEKTRKWYSKNKERQNQNTKNNYYDNKKIWNERKWTYFHRKVILKILSKRCEKCNKFGIKIIHHKEYGKTPKLISGNYSQKENFLLIKRYTKRYLLGFCSKSCHKSYERSKNKHL